VSWIDDDKAELERQRHSVAELRAIESKISNQSGTIYENLWKEILNDMTEAENKGLARILTNGSPYARKLIVPQPIKSPQTYSSPHEFELRLTDNQQAITLKGPKTAMAFPLFLGEDQVVRIKYEGEERSVKEVAALILRPMLFPDLYGPK